MKKIRKAGAWLLAGAMTVSTFAYAVPSTVQAADGFTGVLNKVDSVDADGNVVEISFNDEAVKGRITFLENGVFRYNVDPSGEFSEYAKVRGGYPDTGKIQAQPDDSDRYSKPAADVKSDDEKFTITNEDGDTTIEFDKDTAKMTVKTGNKVVMEEETPLNIGSSSTVQTLVKHDATNYSNSLSEQFFGGGTQNGRFVHTGEVINIANESKWNDGNVSSPSPFYYTTNGYGVLRNTWQNGSYDFGATDGDVVTATHNENEYDAYIFVSSGTDGSTVSEDLLDGYYKVTGNPALLPEYGFYLGHLNAYNRDAWSDTAAEGYGGWTIKGNAPYTSAGTTTYEAGGTDFEIKENQQAETLNGTGPKVSTDNVPSGVTYDRKWSAQAVLDEYLDYDMPFGFFLPNDGYGAGYGQNGYNMTGGVNPDGSSSEARLAAVAANVENLEVFAKYADSRGVATGLWTQSNLKPDSNNNTYWHVLRDFEAEVTAGVTTLKTDVAWVGAGYSFQLSGVKDAYETVTDIQNIRPNIISLDGWAGSQRYNSVWTGDQTGGNWEYIRFHIPTFIGQSLSGNPNIGSDMDGIWGGDPVIATRDYQWKSFAPQMLDMDGWGRYAKGPYVHGDPYTGVSRMYLKLKAMMMPYIYTNAYAASNIDTGNDDTGLPMMRAMFLEFPEESYAYTNAGSKYQYMWGENLLVAPLYQNTQADDMGNDIRNGIYLPGGEDTIWIDYFTGDQYRGGQVLNNFDAPLWKIPLFVKNGAIIPMYAEHNVADPAADNGVDKTQRIIEFWPDGDSDFSAIEDDGTYVSNTTSEVDGYGTVDDVDYGDHVTTKYTSSVKDGTATLTAEKSEGSYEGYSKEKKTTFVVNASEEPTSVEAYNGENKLEAAEAESKDAFDAAVPEAGHYVYFYDARPEIETFASDTETEIAAMVKGVEVSGKLYVKFAETDTQENAQKLVIGGFVNEGELNGTELNESLQAPTLSENEEARTPTSITLTWPQSADATGYEILVDGEVDGEGNVTSGMINSVPAVEGETGSFTHTDLDYASEHTYYIRSVNAEGHSAWSSPLTTQSAEDPYRLTPDVTADQVIWEGAIYGNHNAILAFDQTLQTGDAGFHSDGNSIGQKLTVDYGNAYVLDYVEYYPRDDAGNGTVTQMRVETSLDGVNWIQHGDQTDADGNKYFQLAQDATTKKLDLGDPNTSAGSIGARYIRFTPLASVGNFFSASELKVYTIDGGVGSADKPFRAGNTTGAGMSEPTEETFRSMFQKNSSAHKSSKDPNWVGEIQEVFGDINFNGISDIWDYAFTAFYVDGGTQKTGDVAGDILLLPSATEIKNGDTFTISVTAIDVQNLNAYGSIINYDPDKLDYMGTTYDGTSAMYVQGMTGNITYDDGTAYINHNAINMGDKPLVNGSKVLATITMQAKTDITLNDVTDVGSDDFVIDLSTVTLMGPTFTVKESKAVTEVEIPEIITEGRIPNEWIVNAVAKTTGPNEGAGGSDDISYSLDQNPDTYTNSNYNNPEIGKPQQYDFELNDTILLDKVRILPRSNLAGAPNSVIVSVSTDGQSYQEVFNGSIDDKTAEFKDVDFDNVEARYVRIVMDSASATVVTTAEVELIMAAAEELTGIAAADTASKEIHVGYLGNVDAVISPENYPNPYFTAESSDESIARIITLTDENGGPVYKVLGVKEGNVKITLTSAADENITCKYDLAVLGGPDKTDLKEAIQATDGVVKSIYTTDSYAAYKAARDYALEIDGKGEASRAEVEKATSDLLSAYEALEVQPVDESLILKESIVTGGEALYSESNTYDKMFDKDEYGEPNLNTYWESPYGGENAKLPQDVVLTLADSYQLEQVSFTSHTIQNGGVTKYTVSVSLDGKSWTEVASGTVDANAYKQGQNVRVDARFAPADAKYVKFTVEGAVGRVPEEDNMYGRIADMDLYGTTKADKTKLNNLIATVKGLDQSKYTEESWAALSEPLAAAEAVAADNSAATAEVTEAYNALNAAYTALDEVTDPPIPVSPREELAQLISEVSGIANDNYTADSWEKFDQARKDAWDMWQDASASDDAIRAMIETLKEARAGLVKDWKAELGDLVAEMETVPNDNYTDVTWDAFQAKLAEAKAMLDAGTATNDEMLAMAQALQAAYDNLVKKDGGQPGTGAGGSGTDGDKAVETGDAASPAGLLAVLAISGGAVVVLARRKKVR
jgi:alpha-glucosidase (family GH31 glycosyl hydrolase)